MTKEAEVPPLCDESRGGRRPRVESALSFLIVARTSSPAFDEHESPTAKRAHLDAVDLANAANKTQEINPRALLGDRFDEIERERTSSDVPGGRTSGTQPVVTADAVARYQRKFELPEDVSEGAPPAPHRARFFTRLEGRVLVTPSLLAIAIVLSLVAGFFAGRLR